MRWLDFLPCNAYLSTCISHIPTSSHHLNGCCNKLIVKSALNSDCGIATNKWMEIHLRHIYIQAIWIGRNVIEIHRINSVFDLMSLSMIYMTRSNFTLLEYRISIITLKSNWASELTNYCSPALRFFSLVAAWSLFLFHHYHNAEIDEAKTIRYLINRHMIKLFFSLFYAAINAGDIEYVCRYYLNRVASHMATITLV